jgi:colanic acid/amylovoran biosynthesis glycosyltransferase
VSVGRLHWVKGYEFALQAVRQTLDLGIDVRYEIIGPDKGTLPSVLLMISELGLEDHVRVSGARTHEEVLDALQTADVFLLSSVSEGLNTATLEAMATGLATVVTDVGGMPEAVRDGVEGFVVPARDSGALAKAIVELATEPERRQRMGEAGRRRVCEQFDVRTCTRAMLPRYEHLVARRWERTRPDDRS